MDQFQDRLKGLLADRAANSQLRTRRIVRPLDAVHVEIDGKKFVNFASNNYLGLTHHAQVIAAARGAVPAYGAGTGAAALVTGYTDQHAAAERAIAKWKGTESAVLLPSGYQANVAAIQTLASGGNVRFLLDKLVHASLIDAVRATEQPMRVFPHNHLPKLRRLLDDADPNQLQIVVTESIFSMEGDAAPLREIVQLKREKNFVLLLDEAHGSGVYGKDGAGYANECGVSNDVDVFVITLSKALGCAGGAICGSKVFIDAVANFGRAYVYSTSAPASAAAACMAAIDAMQREPQRQNRVRELSVRVREKLASAGFDLPAGDSPIIPIIVGEDKRAIQLAERMEADGMLVWPMRPPTVPRGSSRVRITLSSEHTDGEIEKLCEVIMHSHHERKD